MSSIHVIMFLLSLSTIEELSGANTWFKKCMIECSLMDVIHWYSHACIVLDQSAVPVQEEKLASDRSSPI